MQIIDVESKFLKE